jgi:hypothetical protein
MLHLVMKSIPLAPFTVAHRGETARPARKLQFLIQEVRTFRTMLDELRRAQRAEARYQILPHWNSHSSLVIRDEFYGNR